MIYLGPLFPLEREKELLTSSRVGLSNAANTFQWNLLKGLTKYTNVRILNALPIGTWPRYYNKIVLPDRHWQRDKTTAFEVGCFNVPFIKQLGRYFRAKKILKRWSKDDPNILMFTPYFPFLCALSSLPSDVRITLIVTDLPEFADMRQIPKWRKQIRTWHTKAVYRKLDCVDGFIFLTAPMQNAMGLDNRPAMVMEGICAQELPETNGSIPTDQSDDIILLYSGRLNARYGLPILLEAFQNIKGNHIKLWLCGAGEMQKEICSQAAKDPRIKFWGYLSHRDTLALQRQADILINPRPNEEIFTKYSFPSKTMEYMLSGKTVVMYKLDGVPDTYDPYLFYVPEPNALSMKQTLEYVINLSEEERRNKALLAQQFIYSHKNPDVQARRVLNFMESL